MCPDAHRALLYVNLPRVDVDEDCRICPLCGPPVKTTCLIAQLERG